MDSTTMELCSELLRGVGRKRLDGARKKGGIKVHAMMNPLKRCFRANIIKVIRLHLLSYGGLLEFIWDTYKAWRKTHNASLAFAT
jgi:hypothetical protein